MIGTAPIARDPHTEPLSRSEIDALLSILRDAPPDEAPPAQRLQYLLSCDRAFGTFEHQYTADPESLRPHLAELKLLRTLNDARRVKLAAPLADEFAAARRRAAELEARSAELRQSLIRLCTQTGLASIDGSESTIHARTRHARDVPKAGDPARATLESALKRLNLWENVASLYAPRLTKLLNERCADVSLADIRALCPERTVWEIRIADRGGAAQ